LHGRLTQPTPPIDGVSDLMLRVLGLGLMRGLLFGLVYAWADTLTIFMIAKNLMKIVLTPFTNTTLYLASWGTLFCVVLGGIIGLIGGKRLEKNPGRFALVMGGVLAACVLINAPDKDVTALGLVGVAVATGVTAGLLWLESRHRLALPVGFAALPLIWFVALSQGQPPEEDSHADPNRPRPAAQAPNILWIIMDTTRVDHLSAYGYDRDTTPTLEKLASEGTLFERAYATAPWTVASHAGMFTGKYSSQHWCMHEHPYLEPTQQTIAGLLKDAGWETAIFAGNPWLDHYTGLIGGFSDATPSWREFNFTLYNLSMVGRIRVALIAGGQDKGAMASNKAFEDWLNGQRDDTRPFFAFINYLEPHAPYHEIPLEDRFRYLPDEAQHDAAVKASRRYMAKMVSASEYNATAEERAGVIALYDGGIHNTDRRIGEVLDLLRQKGILDHTLVIVGADHGEMFGTNHVYGHDPAIYHPLLHVPLILRMPGEVPAGLHVDAPVQLIDIFPTILELLGLSDHQPEDVRGRSLWTAIAGKSSPTRPVFAEYFTPRLPPLKAEISRLGFSPDNYRLKAVQIRDLRAIQFPGHQIKLFDLIQDPNEQHDLATKRPEDLATLTSLLTQFALDNPPRGDTLASGKIPEMDAATREKLRSLGYIQ